MEYSPIQAIDFALGRLLVDVYDKPQNGPKNWQAFLNRPASKKILRGDFDTVQDIIKSMESSQKQASQKQASTNAPGGTVKANPVNLPLVVYGRKPNIMVSEAEAADYQIGQVATGPSGADLRLSVAMLNVEYRIAMLAWDRPTLDNMQLAWLFHVATPGQHRVSYNAVIGGEELTISGELLDPRTPTFEDTSLDRSEGRIHAVTLTATVKIYAIMGAEAVIPSALRWMLGNPLDSEFGPGSFAGIDGEGGLCNGDACWPNRQ